jgi:hypothetical protein
MPESETIPPRYPSMAAAIKAERATIAQLFTDPSWRRIEFFLRQRREGPPRKRRGSYMDAHGVWRPWGAV